MMSRRRKRWYFTLMIVGAAALTVDRYVLSDERAAASSLRGDSVQASPLTRRVKGGTRGPVDRLPPAHKAAHSLWMPELPFPRRLSAEGGFDPSASGVPIRDLFAPPTLGGSTSAQDSTALATDKDRQRSTPSKRGGHASSATFVMRHRLSGVLLHESLRIAVVDGTWMQIGQSMDGCTLVAVRGNEARFECHDAEALMRVTDKDNLMRD